MKDWKMFLVILGLLSLIMVCEGCNVRGSAREPNKKELLEDIARQTGWGMHEISLQKLELTVRKPPIWEYRARGPYGVQICGQCSLNEYGRVRNVTVNFVE